jgi:hypothetical protein
MLVLRTTLLVKIFPRVGLCEESKRGEKEEKNDRK